MLFYFYGQVTVFILMSCALLIYRDDVPKREKCRKWSIFVYSMFYSLASWFSLIPAIYVTSHSVRLGRVHRQIVELEQEIDKRK